MSHSHIVASFGEELERLSAQVAQLGGQAEALLADAVQAVVKRDVELARQVIERDKVLDELQAELERAAFRVIALRQPMAADLRRAVAAIKISMSLERVGDMAKGIAKRLVQLDQAEGMTSLTRSFGRMGALVQTRLKAVLDAYARGEVEGLVEVWTHDDEVDDHYESLFRELLTYMMGDARMIGAATHLLFMAKNLERVGDHATNIAEMAHYDLTGQPLAGERPRGEPTEV